MKKALRSVINFYYEGFRDMSVSNRKLWLIILIKLFLMFAILKVFFFPDFLNSRFDSDEEKGSYVIEQLTKDK